MNSVVIGLQYGDEGKGRVCGYFLENENYDWSVRFGGGPNCGHTVYSNGKQYKFHQLPSGAAFGKKIALDTGMVLDINKLRKELETVKNIQKKIYISENVHIIQEQHLKMDASGSGIGSTKSGMAYVYGDRALRKGIRFIDIETLNDFGFDYIMYSGLPPIEKNENALFEGAQGIMLDIDYGNYPYVTSTSVFPSIVHNISKKIGVMKAYTSRVGDGPPYYEDIEELRNIGGEFGTTTGRPRKCTWNDMAQLKYAINLLNPDEIVVTKMDILEGIDICVYDEKKKKITIGNIDSYINFLLENFKQIRYISKSPTGKMEIING